MKSSIRKGTAFILAIILLFSTVACGTNNNGSDNEKRNPQEEGLINDSVLEAKTTDKPETFFETTYDDVITVSYSEIDLATSSAKQRIDSGKILYISRPEVSAEQISEKLGIPKTGTSHYNDALLIAYSIFKHEDSYVFTNHYILFADSLPVTDANNGVLDTSVGSNAINMEVPLVGATTPSNFEVVTTVPEFIAHNDILFINKIDHAKSINATLQSRVDVIDAANNVTSGNTDDLTSRNTDGYPSRSATLPSNTATVTYNDILYVYGINGSYYGYINCTVSAYYQGQGKVAVGGGSPITRNIYDVVSYVKAYPQPGYSVAKYKVSINANHSVYANLYSTTLPTAVNISQGVKISGSYGASGGSGTVEYNTSYTYNPESQYISESSSIPKIVEWTATTVSPTSGKAYDIAPGMRIASDIGYQYGAHSTIYCDAMILGITIKSNSIVVGGFF